MNNLEKKTQSQDAPSKYFGAISNDRGEVYPRHNDGITECRGEVFTLSEVEVHPRPNNGKNAFIMRNTRREAINRFSTKRNETTTDTVSNRATARVAPTNHHPRGSKLPSFGGAGGGFLLLLLLFTTPTHAQINNVPYIDENGVTQTANNVTLLTTGGTQTLTNGWYMFRGLQNFSGMITISGVVHLILENSCSWAITNGGIRVNGTNNLTIYSQSAETNVGKLIVTGAYECAGLGGGSNQVLGNITINGGEINAIGGMYASGIGIGDNTYGGATGGKITINNGIVTSSGVSPGGSGIGGGSSEIVINGGFVTATAISYGAGIGGVANNITITGGIIFAIAEGSGSGIGGQGGQNGGNITIIGGSVTASSNDGAGIGSGVRVLGGAQISGGNITLEGGIITTISNGLGAGIGGGFGPIGAQGGSGGNITIRGGVVTANGGVGSGTGMGGAGIGGGGASMFGSGGAGGTVIISGGNINATGGVNAADIGGGGGNSNHGLLINGSNQNVYRNRLKLQNVANIIPITSASYGSTQYGTTDVKTNSDGLLYFYFPSASNVAISVSTASANYGETYNTPSDHTAAIRTLPVISPLSAPRNFTATPGNTQVSLSWIAPANDGNSPILRYEVSSNNGANWITAQTNTSNTFTGLTNGTQYTFKVRAVNAIGNGDEATTTATPRTVPSIPQNFTATPDNAQVSLSWSLPANDGGSPIIRYEVSSNNGANWVTAQTNTNHTFTGLTNGTSYTFKVRAVNAAGSGVEATATATPVGPPTAPQNFVATPDNAQVSLSWTAPANNGGSPITRYEVSSDNGANWITAQTNTSHTFTGLTNGTQYTFRVRAVNAIGNGEEAVTTATPNQSFTVILAANPPNGGTVEGEGTFIFGQNVTVIAKAASNFNFVNWTEYGNIVSTNVSYLFTVTANRNLIANFDFVGNIQRNNVSGIVLYPNPFTKEIKINQPELVKNVKITNLAGQFVKEVTFDGKSISTGELSSGVYFVKVESANGEKGVYKMVKR